MSLRGILMKQIRMKNRSAKMPLLLLAFFSGMMFFARAAEGQCQDATATRPILFVPGFNENSTAWGGAGGVRGGVMSSLASTPGYSSTKAQAEYDLYFDGSNVRLAQATSDQLLPGPVASSSNIPCDARNFAISFYGWATNVVAFDALTVDQVSILTKAYELSQVLKAIAGLTYVQDVIVIAHSMGALDARAYVEGLGSTYAPCNNASQPCYLPGSLQYTDEVGHLITLDGANAGANLAALACWVNISPNVLNIAELEPNSPVVWALNYNGGYPDQLGSDALARPLPAGMGIDAIISYYGALFVPCTLTESVFCTWDGVVTNDSQSIADPLFGEGFTNLNDFPNAFSAAEVSLAPNCVLDEFTVLHLLPCLGDYHSSVDQQTASLVYQRADPYLVGQLTTVNIKTTYNGLPYPGPISLALQTPVSSISITNPDWTLRGPLVPSSPQVPSVPAPTPAPYTLTFISGGPSGAGAPTILGGDAELNLCSPCYPQPGNWSLTFLVEFNSAAPSQPTVTAQASAVSGDGATLMGPVNSSGANSTAWFEWGPSPSLGNSTPTKTVGAGMGTSNLAYTLSGLESSTAYYYRLDATNAAGTTYGNPVSSFTTSGTLLAPTLLTPTNSATGATTSPTFTWSGVGGAASYRVLIATNSAALPTDPTSPSCGVGCVLDAISTGTSYTPPAGVLQAATTYYWKVHARGVLQFGEWPLPYNFTTTGPTLASVSVSPATVISGSTATVTVTLNGPAPATGAQISMASSNTSAFPVQSSVTIAAWSTTASTSLTAGSLSTSTSATITASYSGSQANAVVTISPSGGSVFISSLTITPSTIVGGYPSQGNVFLTGPAPPGGATVSISSNNTHFVQVPASQEVVVQPGYTSGTFPITTSFTSGSVGATINATYNNTMYGATLAILPLVPSTTVL